MDEVTDSPPPDDRQCGDCGKTADEILKKTGRPAVMVAMQPGHDGKPWQLCSRCWCDGMHHPKTGTIIEGTDPPVQIVDDPRIAAALALEEAPAPAPAKPKRKRKAAG